MHLLDGKYLIHSLYFDDYKDKSIYTTDSGLSKRFKWRIRYYGDYQSFYVLPSGMNVLEVKFDNILPSYIRNIVESYNFKQGSFSKYYYGRKILDCYMR